MCGAISTVKNLIFIPKPLPPKILSIAKAPPHRARFTNTYIDNDIYETQSNCDNSNLYMIIFILLLIGFILFIRLNKY